MFTVQDFLNVYGQELCVGVSTKEQCTLSYIDSSIYYTEYNGKIEIRFNLPDDPKHEFYSLIYDEGMDWVVMYQAGRRTHYKQVSKGHDIITPELYQQILLLKENVMFDYRNGNLRTEMSNYGKF